MLKYGAGPDLARERLVYAAYLDPEIDPVPRLVGSATFPADDGPCHVLALDWVDGRLPDFESGAEVSRVFHRLGAWGATWSARLLRSGGAPLGAVRRRVPADLADAAADFAARTETEDTHAEQLAGHARACLSHAAIVSSAGGRPLQAALRLLCGPHARPIARAIAALPPTLDGGDLSLHNVLVDDRHGLYFIDFECAAITSPAIVLDILGKPWGSIPRGALAAEALRAYAAGWNAEREAPALDPDALRDGQRCARILYASGELDDWFGRLAAGDEDADLPSWVEAGSRELVGLLAAVDPRLPM